MKNKNLAGLVMYLVLVFAGSSVFYIQAFNGASIEQVALPLMWMPALAALITQFVLYRTVGGLGWQRGSWRYLLVAMLIPIGYCLLIYLPVWLLRLGGIDLSALGKALALLPLGILIGIVSALGEEIGWRGFLAPAFYRANGFAWASIATGVIWGLWHLPLILGSNYNAGTPAWYSVPCFMLSVTGISVMLAWLRLRSASFWPAVLFHATHNAVIQGVFDTSTVNTGPTIWITSEFGIGLTIVSILLGVYFWRRRDELPINEALQNDRAQIHGIKMV